MAVYEEPRIYEVLRDLAGSGDDRLREVKAGRAVADARTLVRDRDALAEALRDAEAEATRWRSLALRLADLDAYSVPAGPGEGWDETVIKAAADAAEHAYEFTPYAEMAQHAWPNAIRAAWPIIAAHLTGGFLMSPDLEPTEPAVAPLDAADSDVELALRDVWGKIHPLRFAHKSRGGDVGGPDNFYNGVTHAERVVERTLGFRPGSNASDPQEKDSPQAQCRHGRVGGCGLDGITESYDDGSRRLAGDAARGAVEAERAQDQGEPCDTAPPIKTDPPPPADRLGALLGDQTQAEQLLRRAIADPGQFLRRAGWGTDDAESITSWSARAVLAALREVAGL